MRLLAVSVLSLVLFGFSPAFAGENDEGELAPIVLADPVTGMPYYDYPAGTDEVEPNPVDDSNWPLATVRIYEAWELLAAQGKRPGQGVMIAQIDTGVSYHPVLRANKEYSPIAWSLGRDFMDGDTVPFSDSVVTFPLYTPGHGTSSAGIVVGNLSAAANSGKWSYPRGASPGVKLVPIRVHRTPVLWSQEDQERFRKGLDYAVSLKPDIIGISMGMARGNDALEKLLEKAENQGTIVVCASGQITPWVVYPGSSRHVISVNAVDYYGHLWGQNPHGQVDVSAPGVNVWHPQTVPDKDGKDSYSYRQNSGTSFSSALVSSVAALWMSYHGRENLVRKYGKENLVSVFRKVLTKSGVTPFENGADNALSSGILNAEALLKAPLP